MITSNVIHRTFNLRYEGFAGTAFALDHAGNQYLITARHVVAGVASGEEVELFHERQWKPLNVAVVGAGSGEVDIAVLACSMRLAPPFQLAASTAGMVYGQDIYFLGFPFGWNSAGEEINRNFPLPFVKSGIGSAVPFGDPGLLYLDAHGNPGFSGGPVVFREPGKPKSDYKVAGVVVNGPTPVRKPIIDERGSPLVLEDGEGAYLAENQGFVVAVDIRHALEIIDANPIGFSLPPEEAE